MQYPEKYEQRQPLVPEGDPFQGSKYNSNAVDDDPLPQAQNMVDSMINNDEVPEDVKTKNWWVFTKDNVLGFLDSDRKNAKLLNFDIIRGDHLATIKRREFTFENEHSSNILMNVFETKLDRSVGSDKSNIMNERRALISQVSENRNVSDDDESMMRDGFIKKLLGRKK